MGAPATNADLPDRYEVIEVLGRGGGGVVLRAHDSMLQRDVAIKLLHEGDADLIREAQIIANLDHPNIVRVHEVAEDGRFIVMELVHGDSLAEVCEAMPPAEVRRIGCAVLDALDHAHVRGVTHRDVKPSNILLANDGTVKLADFGIAKGALDPTTSGLVRGTPAYMAPEQARGRYDARSDLYGLGATLFELATGRRLHAREGSETNPFGAVLEATRDRALAMTIARAVEERPDARFADASGFRIALARTLGLSPRRKRVFALLASIAVGSAGGALYPLETAPTPTEASTLAVLPFEHDDQTGPLADALAHRLAMELRRDDRLLVIPAPRLREVTLAQLPTTDEMVQTGIQLGANVLVRGSVLDEGSQVRMSLTLHGRDFRRDALVERGEALERMVTWVADLREAILGARQHEGGLDLVALGEDALARHDISAALEHLSTATESSPRNAHALYLLTVARWWAGRPSTEVRATLATALAAEGLEPNQRGFLRALGAFLDGQYDQATTMLQREVRNHPGDAQLLYGLFEALFHGGHPEEAMETHAQLRRAHPTFRLGIAHVVDYLATQGRGDELAFVDTLDLDAKPFWWAQVPLASGDVDEAIRRAQSLTLQHRLPVHDSHGNKALAGLYLLSGNPELAHAAVQELDATDSAIVLASIAARSGERDEDALRHLLNDHAGNTHARYYEWLDTVAFVQVDASDELRARLHEDLDEFIREDHRHDIRTHVARLLLTRGEIDLHRGSPMPEVAAVAEALDAERDGRWDAAAESWERAARNSPDGTFSLVEHFRAAGAFRRAHDSEAVVASCESVLQPHRFRWSWASHAPVCARWTMAALRELGREAEAAQLQHSEDRFK